MSSISLLNADETEKKPAAKPAGAEVEATKPKSEETTSASAKTDSADPSADEMAIRRNAAEYVIAYQEQDAEKLASMWAPNAVWVDGKTGERVEGREAIQAHFSSHFENSDPLHLEVQIRDVHFTTSTVAVEDGTATIVREGEEPVTTSYTAVHVLVDGKWLIDSIRETDLPPPATASERLSQLDWLEGSWVDESEDATVLTTYHWTPNRNFLVHSFSVLIDGKLNMQGTQIIGWDASQNKIRSWMFDSDGGFSEGSWESTDENRWVIRHASTLPDGRHGSSINVLTKKDDDTFTWKSSGRQIEGVMLPSIDEFTIVRQTTEEPLNSELEESTDELQ